MPGVDEIYVLAREVLLDALQALGPHRNAVVLVGAQAVYLRVGEADLAVAAFTTDGDLVIDPAILDELPPIEQGLGEAGFAPKGSDSIGVWVSTRSISGGIRAEVAIDLLVPEAVAPGTGRRAKLRGHDERAARTVRGLEGALVDAEPLSLGALEQADSRRFEIQVAGAAALLLSKLHKIDDRQGSRRQNDKDALDILRLLRGTSAVDLADRYRRLLGDERSKATAIRGIELLRDQFGRRGAIGSTMIQRAAGPLADPEELAASAVLLAEDLLNLLKS
jgi:hypothetical protein